MDIYRQARVHVCKTLNIQQEDFKTLIEYNNFLEKREFLIDKYSKRFTFTEDEVKKLEEEMNSLKYKYREAIAKNNVRGEFEAKEILKNPEQHSNVGPKIEHKPVMRSTAMLRRQPVPLYGAKRGPKIHCRKRAQRAGGCSYRIYGMKIQQEMLAGLLYHIN